MKYAPLLMFAVACAGSPAKVPEPVQFDDAPVNEPEAGPAPAAVLDTGPAPDAAPDAGAPIVLDAAVDAGVVVPDTGPVDAGKLIEPILPSADGKAQFEQAMKVALDDPVAGEKAFDALVAAAPEFYFAHYNAALCRLRQGDAQGGEARLREVHDRFGAEFHLSLIHI